MALLLTFARSQKVLWLSQKITAWIFLGCLNWLQDGKVAAFCKQYMPDEISRSWTIDRLIHSDFHMIIRCISGAFAKMTCPTCDQAAKRAVGKRSQAKDHGTKLEPLWTIVIGDWTSSFESFVRNSAFVSLGERLSGDCLGEASVETACNFLPEFFFHFSCWWRWRSLPLPSMPWMKCFDPPTTSVHYSRWSRQVGKFLGNFHSKKCEKMRKNIG